MADTQNQSPGLLANILAVAGFIILIVIIVWGAYHLLRLTGSGISSLFTRIRGGSAIELTAPATATSGTALTVSWKYSPTENGTYALLYQCKSGFRFEMKTPAGTQAALPCGNAYTLGTATNVSLTPILTGTSSLDVPLSVVFMPSATTSTSRPQGAATIRVTAAAGAPAPAPAQPSTPAAPATPKPSTSGSTPGSGTIPKVSGPADISVHIIAVGVIDARTNMFVARAPISAHEIMAVKFDIGNIGASPTGTWNFTAQLPSSPVHTFVSPAQRSLAPGDHIENTLRFSPVAPGGGMIFISVDPANTVRESNEGNNNASQWVNGGYQLPGYRY